MKKPGLWVDDVRELPAEYAGWDVARSYHQAIELLSSNEYDAISLDHDIASWDNEGIERTGYDITKWLTQRKFDGLPVPTTYYVHSANPVGADNMKHMINRYLSEELLPTTKDAAVIKALAELGFRKEPALTPEEEQILKRALDTEEQFFYDARRLLTPK